MKEKILKLAQKNGEITTANLLKHFPVSRQYLNHLIKELVDSGELVKFGKTQAAFYVLPKNAKAYKPKVLLRYVKSFKNEGLEEHVILDDIERTLPAIGKLPENVRSIFTYAFSEMFNNAIEHSQSSRIRVEVEVGKKDISFVIQDGGIGVFRNVMRKRKLKSELEAIQDILKGKTTTMPKSHSGEGIFFTSKVGDSFTLDSFGYELMMDNKLPDVFVKTLKKTKKGTTVAFSLSTHSDRHLNDVFRSYANLSGEGDYGFDKTEIRIKLYAIGGVHISRSQARRVLSGLEKFKIIVFDFDQVPTVGQAFADEVFRVFQNKHPDIKLETENMDTGVRFMIERARNSLRIKE